MKKNRAGGEWMGQMFFFFIFHMSVRLLPALLDCVSSQQRVNNRINGLLEVLNKDSVPRHYSLFYHIYITGECLRLLDSNGKHFTQ